MVVPILTYGSEIWGVYNFKEVDALYIKFCKYILGVKKQTPTMAVFGEIGRFPLSVICKERSLKFWTKIMKNQESPTYHMYMDQLISINGPCWSKRINSLINHLGLSHLLVNFNPDINFCSIKRRIRDQFLQTWTDSISNMSKLEYYKQFKKDFEFSQYLDIVQNESMRKSISRLRLCSHNLEIESGRFSGTDRNQRLCKMCSQNVIESEYHFIMCCPKYNQIRNKYLGRISWPNLNKFISIMSSTNKRSLLRLGKYIQNASEVRMNALKE